MKHRKSCPNGADQSPHSPRRRFSMTARPRWSSSRTPSAAVHSRVTPFPAASIRRNAAPAVPPETQASSTRISPLSQARRAAQPIPPRLDPCRRASIYRPAKIFNASPGQKQWTSANFASRRSRKLIFGESNWDLPQYSLSWPCSKRGRLRPQRTNSESIWSPMERSGHTNVKSVRRHSHIWRQWICSHADICSLMSLQYSGLLTSYLGKSIVN